jgi:2-isopropylmalate synthase
VTGKISEIKIKDYGLASISGGSNALCEVTIKVEDANGNRSSAKSVGEDIVTTSVKAVIDGLNRIMLKKLLQEKKVEN